MATRPTPIATIRTLVGTRPSRTNPVANVPVIAPTVPTADSRPTIEPLVAKSVNVPRTSIGAVAERMVAGSTKAVVASTTIASSPSPSPTAPMTPTIGTAAIALMPPRMNAGPRSGSGPTLSAIRPPLQAPSAMPARIAPMIPV